ncbi:rhomboid family intramembrane serine protease [Crocinitomicaceae bacterium]|nr:rhomboid family intramembrane serine protease [Crocinitomicaceae bacterium]
MKSNNHPFGSSLEALVYPTLLLVVMWLVYWADHLSPLVEFYRFGVLPGDFGAMKGIAFMPLIHSKAGLEHILNNSLPTMVLLAAIVYYYRQVALRVFMISWIGTGFGLWFFAANTNSYHIGMSGVIYAMAGFLFTSGVLRRYRPLQAISLFVAFLYGSMIWGIFPTESHVSWEGHLSGLVVGILLAFYYRKQGPQSPKYLYEIEKELGIEPPDLEGMWKEKVAEAKAQELQDEKEEWSQNNTPSSTRIIYHYRPKSRDDSDPQ